MRLIVESAITDARYNHENLIPHLLDATMKIFKWTLAVTFSLFIIIALGGYLWLKSTVPDYNRRLATPLRAPVHIARDGYGFANMWNWDILTLIGSAYIFLYF